MKKILVIAPHMDDEVLGCGGTIARYVKNGDIVNVCFISNRVYDHRIDPKLVQRDKQYAEHAKDILGYQYRDYSDLCDESLSLCKLKISILIENKLKHMEPDVVFVPHRGDNNPDHRAVFEAAMVALRPAVATGIRHILCYEVPSSTDQSPPFPEYAFQPNFYVNIDNHLNQKLSALACYKSEVRQYPHPRSVHGVVVNAEKRGMEIGYNAAEAFVMVRGKE